MCKYHLLLLALASTTNLAFADIQCSDSSECWPEGGSMNTGLIFEQKRDEIEKALDRKHKELINVLSSSSAEMLLSTLKTQQAAWLKYRTEECELIGALTGAGGTWPSTYARKCELNHTDQRLRRVQSAIHCIKNIPLEKRSFEQNKCLQQLAPLTNK